jgi:hypothetical protein
MLPSREEELIKLQDQLDRERELFERARKSEEANHEPRTVAFCMTDLYATIPGCNYAPIRINSYRP